MSATLLVATVLPFLILFSQWWPVAVMERRVALVMKRHRVRQGDGRVGSRRSERAAIIRIAFLALVVGGLQIGLHLCASSTERYFWGFPVNVASSLLYPFTLAVILFVCAAGTPGVVLSMIILVIAANGLTAGATWYWGERWDDPVIQRIFQGAVLQLVELVFMILGYWGLIKYTKVQTSVGRFLWFLLVLQAGLLFDSVAYPEVLVRNFPRYEGEYWRLLSAQAVTKVIFGSIYSVLLFAHQWWPKVFMKEDAYDDRLALVVIKCLIGVSVVATVFGLQTLATLEVLSNWWLPVIAVSSLLYSFLLSVIMICYIDGSKGSFRWLCVGVLIANVIIAIATHLLPTAAGEMWVHQATRIMAWSTVLQTVEILLMTLAYRCLVEWGKVKSAISRFNLSLLILLAALMFDAVAFSAVLVHYFPDYQYGRLLTAQATVKAVGGIMIVHALTWHVSEYGLHSEAILCKEDEELYAVLTCQTNEAISIPSSDASETTTSLDQGVHLSQVTQALSETQRQYQDRQDAALEHHRESRRPLSCPLAKDGKPVNAVGLAAKAENFRSKLEVSQEEARRQALADLGNFESNQDRDWRSVLVALIEDLGFPSSDERRRLAESLLQVAQELAKVPPESRDSQTELALTAALRKFGKVAPLDLASGLTEFVVKYDEEVRQRALIAVRTLFSNASFELESPPSELVNQVYKNVTDRLPRTGGLDSHELGRLAVALSAAAAVDPGRLEEAVGRIANRLPDWQVKFLVDHVEQFRDLRVLMAETVAKERGPRKE